MRVFVLLFFLVTLGSAQDTAGESTSLTDLFQRVLDVEASLKEQFSNEFEKYRTQKEEERQAAAAKLNETAQALENVMRDTYNKAKAAVEKINTAKAEKEAEKKEEMKEFLGEVGQLFDAIKRKKAADEAARKQQFDELMDQLKTAHEKREEEKAAKEEQARNEFKQAIEQIRQKWTDFKTKMEQAKVERDEKRKQKMKEMKNSLNELKTLVEQEYQARQDKKLQRKEESTAQMNKFKEDLKAQKAALDTQTAELMEKYGAYSEQKEHFQDTIKAALQAGMKAKMTEYWGDKLQSTLDKAAVKQVIEEEMAKNESPAEAAVAPEAKATILDEITGTSQWQTVTWILLALSILLSVALIVMIVHQVSQRKHYERLEGHDVEQNERTPIARPVVPLGYTQEKAVVPAPSTSLVAAGPPAPTYTAPPAHDLTENKEEKQF